MEILNKAEPVDTGASAWITSWDGFHRMATKKRSSKKWIPDTVPELTETEKDLLWHMEHGYQLETDSLGSDPVLRRLRDDEVLRPPSANRATIKSMQDRGLITETNTRDPLKIVWRINKKAKK